MAFQLEEVVPWGRSFDEYLRMFGLSAQGLPKSILSCADGPASFNAEATARGHSVVSCDPLYQFSPAEIRTRIADTYNTVLAQTRLNRTAFVWQEFANEAELGTARLDAMERFLRDFEIGRHTSRYVVASLPELPWPDHTFDLAICSHFLFLYSQHLSQQFHLLSILEMLRVAREVRIFPIFALDGTQSPYIDPIRTVLTERGWDHSLEQVPYEFVRGANQMLRIQSGSARID